MSPSSADCVAGYLYLKGGRIHLLGGQVPLPEVAYQSMRRKFDVYSCGEQTTSIRRVH